MKKYDIARQATDNKYGAEKMRFACRITKARIKTLIVINNYLFYTSTVAVRKRVSVTLCVHCLSSSSYSSFSLNFPVGN